VELKGIERAAVLLGLSILAAVVRYGGSAHVVVAGAVYLMVASSLCLVCLLLASTGQAKRRKGILEPAVWRLHTRARVLLLSGWQVGIVGWLNLWSLTVSGSRISILLGYLSVSVFLMLSYKLVAIADRSKQEGGPKPLNYFGRPRSRRLLFCAFVLYPIVPLVILGVAWSHWEWCPSLLRLPQLWFLLVALSSAMSAGLIFQRYRAAAPDKALAKKIFFLTICTLISAAAIQAFLVYDAYVYLLSSTTSACIAAEVYWLFLAKEENPLSPEQRPDNNRRPAVSPATG
jgi:hypothetical protein